MIIFIRYLILLTYISVNHCFSVIIIDIEPYNKGATFYDQAQQSVAVYNSLRVLTFDTDAQRITRIDFLAFNPRSTELNQFALDFLNIEFGPSMAKFTVTPYDGFKGIIRKCGAFTCNLAPGNSRESSLSHLDETRLTLMKVDLREGFVHAPFSGFSAALNSHDILEQCKQRKIATINQEIAVLYGKDVPHQYTVSKSKPTADKYQKSLGQIQKNSIKRNELLQRISNIQSGAEKTNRTGITPENFYAAAHWDIHAQQCPVYTALANICNSDELCELACDLTMMEQEFIKLDGKYGGNKGFDGLYMRDNIIIAAESKFWGTPPTLHTVISEKIIPKFDFAHSGAIKHIRKETQDKIEIGYKAQQIYTLPYAMLANWQVDCRLEHFTEEIKFPQPILEENLRTPAKSEIKKEEQTTASQHQSPSVAAALDAAAAFPAGTPTIKIEPTNAEASNEEKNDESDDIKTSDQQDSTVPFIKTADYDISTLTPQSDQKDMQKVLGNLLSSFMEQTHMPSAELKAMLNQLHILNIEPIPFSLESAGI